MARPPRRVPSAGRRRAPRRQAYTPQQRRPHMALDMTPEQREIGQKNYHRAVGQTAALPPTGQGPTRRSFMKGLLAAGAAAPVAAAAYYGYESLHGYHTLPGNPVKTALIGTGDEGGILVGEHNPEYMK